MQATLTRVVLLGAAFMLTGCARKAPPAGKPLSEIVSWIQELGLPDTTDATLSYGRLNHESGYYWLLPANSNETRIITDLCKVTTLSVTSQTFRLPSGERIGPGFEASPYPIDLTWLSTRQFARPDISTPHEWNVLAEEVDAFGSSLPMDAFEESLDLPSEFQSSFVQDSHIESVFMAFYLFQNGKTSEASTLWKSIRGNIKDERRLLYTAATHLANAHFAPINEHFIATGDVDAYLTNTKALLTRFGSLWDHHERVQKQLDDLTTAQQGNDHILGRPLTHDETKLLSLIDGTNNMQIYATSDSFYMWCLGHNTNRLDRPDVLVHLADMRVDAVPLLIELLQDYTPTRCMMSELDVDGLYYLSAIDDDYVAIEGHHAHNPHRAATRAEKAASALRWVVETDPANNPDRLIFDLPASEVNSLKAYQSFCRKWYDIHEGLSGPESALEFVDIDSIYEDVINCVVTRGTPAQRQRLEQALFKEQDTYTYFTDNLQTFVNEAGTNSFALLERVRNTVPYTTNTIITNAETRVFYDLCTMYLSNSFSMAHMIQTAHEHELAWHIISEHLPAIAKRTPDQSLTTLLKETLMLSGRTNQYLSDWTPLDLAITWDAIPPILSEFTEGTNPATRIIAPQHRALWTQLSADTNYHGYIMDALETRYGAPERKPVRHTSVSLEQTLSYLTNVLQTTRSTLRLEGLEEQQLPTVTNFIALSTDTNALISKLTSINPTTTNDINELLTYTERFHTFPALRNHPQLTETVNRLSRRIVNVTLPGGLNANDLTDFVVPEGLAPGTIFSADLGKALYKAATNAVGSGQRVNIRIERSMLLGGVSIDVDVSSPYRPQTATDTPQIPTRGIVLASTYWRDLHQFRRVDPVTLTPAAAATFRSNMLYSVLGQPLEYWSQVDPMDAASSYWHESSLDYDHLALDQHTEHVTTPTPHPDHDLRENFWKRLEEVLTDSDCLTESSLLNIHGLPGARTPLPDTVGNPVTITLE